MPDSKFNLMVQLLMSSPEARKDLFKDPDSLFRKLAVDVGSADSGTTEDQAAMQRAEDLISRSGVSKATGVVAALKQLKSEVSNAYKGNVDVQVDPLGFTLAEIPTFSSLDWTATGTTRCTWSPWDGCRPDVDW